MSTAFFTTGIPNTEVFVPMSESAMRKLQRLNHVRWLPGTSIGQRVLKYRASRHAVKPIEKLDATADTFVWGEAGFRWETSGTFLVFYFHFSIHRFGIFMWRLNPWVCPSDATDVRRNEQCP